MTPLCRQPHLREAARGRRADVLRELKLCLDRNDDIVECVNNNDIISPLSRLESRGEQMQSTIGQFEIQMCKVAIVDSHF